MDRHTEQAEAAQAGAKPEPNPQHAKQHLNLLVAGWGEDEWLELRAIDPAKKMAPLCAFFTPTQIADAVDWAATLNKEGRNLYPGIHARTRRSKAGTDAHVAQARYLMGDLDSQEQVDRCRGVLPSPTFWICTGTVPSLRGQPYWRLDQPLPVANGYEELMEGIRSVAESDDIGNPSRILRLAGMISWPAPHKAEKGYTTELVTLALNEEEPDYQPQEFPSAKPNGAGRWDDFHTGDQVNLEAELAVCRKNEGGWHNSMKKILAHLFGKGYTAGRATEFVRKGGALPEGVETDFADQIAWYAAKQPRIADVLPEFKPECVPPPPEQEEQWIPTLPPGLVGDLAQYGSDIAYVEAPIAALAGALVAVSILAANQAVVAMPRGPVPLNIYALVLAPTGVGKDTVKRVIGHALDATDLKHVAARPASDAALHKHLNNSLGKAYLFMDEFGRRLKFAASKSGNHQQNVLTFAMELFGGALGSIGERTYSSQKPMAAIEGPYVTVAALSVPEEVAEAVSSGDVLNGFLNRFLVFTEPGGGDLDEPAATFSTDLKAQCKTIATASMVRANLEHNADKAVRVSEGSRDFWAIIPTDAARDHLLTFRAACRQHKANAGRLAGLWVRAFEIAVRVGGVVALGCYDGKRLNPQLTLDHAKWATDLVGRLIRQACALVEDQIADSDTERDTKRVLAFIRDAVRHPRQGKWHELNELGGVPRSQITKAFQRIERRQRGQILATLVESQDVEVETLKKGEVAGPALTVYRPVWDG